MRIPHRTARMLTSKTLTAPKQESSLNHAIAYGNRRMSCKSLPSKTLKLLVTVKAPTFPGAHAAAAASPWRKRQFYLAQETILGENYRSRRQDVGINNNPWILTKVEDPMEPNE